MTKFLFGMAVLLLSVAAQADTVWMVNGDRLTGKVTLLDGGKLLLETDYGGTIALQWDKVRELETDEPMQFRMPDLPVDYQARLETSGEAGKVILAGSDQRREMALAELDSIVRPHPFLGDWSFGGTVDLAGDWRLNSHRSQDFSVAGNFQGRHGLWRHSLRWDYLRKKQDSDLKSHRYNGAYTLDRFVSRRMFWQGRAQYDRDFLEDLSRRSLLGFGPGYQFWDDELGAFSVSGLLAKVRFGYRTADDANFYALGVGWDYMRYFGGKQFQLFTHGEFYRPIGNDADYNLKAEVGLRYLVTNWASLYAKATRSQVAGALENVAETRFSVGLGVTW